MSAWDIAVFLMFAEHDFVFKSIIVYEPVCRQQVLLVYEEALPEKVSWDVVHLRGFASLPHIPA